MCFRTLIGNGKIYSETDNYTNSYEIDIKIVYEICDKYSMFGDYLSIALTDMKKLGLYNGTIPDNTIEVVPTIREFIKGEILYRLFTRQELSQK